MAVNVYSDKRFYIGNRKYLGSKQRLLSFIEQTILERVPVIGRFCDGFSGTGVVAHRFREHAGHVIANDILYSNFVINKAFLQCTPKKVSVEKLAQLMDYLNSTDPEQGYVFQNYSGTYFTPKNAARIDAIRSRIDELVRSNICTDEEFCILLAGLLFAADKVSNTLGQYDAYLKHLGKESYDASGRHLVDSSVYKELRLKLPALEFGKRCDVYNEDVNHLVTKTKGDVLYLDPPYNSRQYVDCYHVLENIARWNKPILYGKTRKFDRDCLKSRFSRKREAARALLELISSAAYRYIFISYNNEGIISGDEVTHILAQRGTVEVVEKPYRIFGNGAGRSNNRPILERIYACTVTTTPFSLY